jgi:transposase
MTVRALQTTAQRIQVLHAEADELTAAIDTLVGQVAPWLVELPGIGAVTAAQILISWSSAGRLRSEAAFAALAGTNPIPASSGQRTRHRSGPIRGPTAQRRPAHHCARPARLRSQTRAYAAWRTIQGKTAVTSDAASSGSSPGSCSNSSSATTNPAWRSSDSLDKP